MKIYTGEGKKKIDDIGVIIHLSFSSLTLLSSWALSLFRDFLINCLDHSSWLLLYIFFHIFSSRKRRRGSWNSPQPCHKFTGGASPVLNLILFYFFYCTVFIFFKFFFLFLTWWFSDFFSALFFFGIYIYIYCSFVVFQRVSLNCTSAFLRFIFLTNFYFSASLDIY